MAFNGVLPAPPVEIAPFGLLSAASVVEHSEADQHWAGHLDVETEACYFKSDVYDICDDTKTVEVLDETSGSRSQIVYPFAITAVDECSTLGLAASNRESRVLRQLELVTQKAVEAEFWSGELATDAANTNRFITKTGSTTVGGGALSPKRALAALEGALAGCGAGARGMIHAPRQVISLLPDRSTEVETVGTGELATQRLVTKLGTVIAAGVGYSGSAPTNAAPSSNRLWMYATGLATVHLGPKAVVGDSQSAWVKASDNTLIIRAERFAAVVWDGCCHFAVEVDVTL